jgi:hypothetical protein
MLRGNTPAQHEVIGWYSTKPHNTCCNIPNQRSSTVSNLMTYIHYSAAKTTFQIFCVSSGILKNLAACSSSSIFWAQSLLPSSSLVLLPIIITMCINKKHILYNLPTHIPLMHMYPVSCSCISTITPA